MKKSLPAALLLVPAAVAALAVPAGASTRTTWWHHTFPCANGKVATVTLKRPDNSWSSEAWGTNPCAGQWLQLSGCNKTGSSCRTYDVDPGTKGHLTLTGPDHWGGANLSDHPWCPGEAPC